MSLRDWALLLQKTVIHSISGIGTQIVTRCRNMLHKSDVSYVLLSGQEADTARGECQDLLTIL